MCVWGRDLCRHAALTHALVILNNCSPHRQQPGPCLSHTCTYIRYRRYCNCFWDNTLVHTIHSTTEPAGERDITDLPDPDLGNNKA
jgi:hypothetical protein